MSSAIGEYRGSRLENKNNAYYRAEKLAELSAERRDSSRIPIVRSVLAAVAKYRAWQLEGAIEEVKEASDLHYYYKD